MANPDVDAPDVDIDALIRGDRSRRPLWLGAAVLGVIVAAAAAFYFARGEEATVAVAPRQAEATQGQLTTTLDLSGTGNAAITEDLSFGTTGTVASVDVEAGDTVVAGQLLATLETTDLELALASAELALLDAQDNLDDLLGGPETVALAQARLAVSEATLSWTNAQDNLDDLLGGPETVALAQARLAVSEATLSWTNAQDNLTEVVAATPSDAAIAAADAAITQKENALSSAEGAPVLVVARAGERLTLATDARDAALADPTSTSLEIASAENLVTAALAELETANRELTTALGKSDDEDFALATEKVTAANSALTTANTALTTAEADSDATVADLLAAQLDVAIAREVLTSALIGVNVAQSNLALVQDAEAAIIDAQLALADAQADRAALFVGPEASDVEAANVAAEKAGVALLKAQTDLAELLEDVDEQALASLELTVRQRELQLQQALDDLASARLLAPFDGVVDPVSIEVGDRIKDLAATAFMVSDPTGIEIALTVSESDVLSLEVGQVGLATFDAIDDIEYPVRVISVSRVPTVQQGVVTYAVTATLLRGADVAAAAVELSVLGDGTAAGSAGFGAFDGRGDFGGGEDRAGRQAGGLGQFFGEVTLPEGVEITDVLTAVLNEEPLPAGITLPDGFEIPEQLSGRLASLVESGVLDGAGGGAEGGAFQRPSGPGGAGGRGDGSPIAGDAPVVPRVLPAPGMSASVTLLLDVRTESVLVPVSAVRQLGDDFFIVVPAADDATERVTVTVGTNDGVSVEVLDGLAAGTTILIGADSAGVPFSATQQLQTTPQGFGDSRGGGFAGPGGGGGGAGGGGGGR